MRLHHGPGWVEMEDGGAVLADALADPGLAAEMGRAMALVRLACGEAA